VFIFSQSCKQDELAKTTSAKRIFGWFDSPYAFDYWVHRLKWYRNFIAVPPVYYFTITSCETPTLSPVDKFFLVDMSRCSTEGVNFLETEAFLSARRIPVLIAETVLCGLSEVWVGLLLLAQIVLPKLPEADFAGVWADKANGQRTVLSYAVKESDVIATKVSVSDYSSSCFQDATWQVKRGRVIRTDDLTLFVFDDESYIFRKPRLERTGLLSINDIELLN
jgi:hypothetical protein